VQGRTYTPDIFVDTGEGSSGFYIEVKGYLPAAKRYLLRCVKECYPSLDLLLILQSNHSVTKGKTRLLDWAARFRIPAVMWRDAKRMTMQELRDKCSMYRD